MFDASRDMDKVKKWQAENLANLVTPAVVQGNIDRRNARRLLEITFAAMFDGNADATATRIAAELGLSVRDVERSDVFEAAYQGETAEEIRKIYGA